MSHTSMRDTFRAASERRFDDKSMKQAQLAMSDGSALQHRARQSLAMSFK